MLNDENNNVNNSPNNVPDSTPDIAPMPSFEREPSTLGQAEGSSEPMPSTPVNEVPVTTSDSAMQPVSPTPFTPDSQTGSDTPVFGAPVDNGTGKSGKKKWIIGGAIAGVLVLLGGGAAFAYTMYQNPDKVVADSLVNILKSQPGSAKANLAYKNSTGDFNVTLTGKGDDKLVNGTITLSANLKEADMKLEGSADFAASINGDGYIKLNNVEELAKKAVDAMVDSQAETMASYGMTITPSEIAAQKQQTLAQFQPIIDKIDNQWIVFKADKSDSATSEEQKCFSDIIEKLRTDKKMTQEIGDAYKKNKFIIVKEELGLKDGSYGYVLDIDDKKADSFGKATESSALVKEVKKCSDDESSNSTDDSDSDDKKDDSENTRFELWVSQWSHQITGVKVSGTVPSDKDSSVNFDLTMDYDKVTDVSVPKDTIDSTELQNDFEEMFSGSASAAAVPSGSATVSL